MLRARMARRSTAAAPRVLPSRRPHAYDARAPRLLRRAPTHPSQGPYGQRASRHSDRHPLQWLAPHRRRARRCRERRHARASHPGRAGHSSGSRGARTRTGRHHLRPRDVQGASLPHGGAGARRTRHRRHRRALATAHLLHGRHRRRHLAHDRRRRQLDTDLRRSDPGRLHRRHLRRGLGPERHLRGDRVGWHPEQRLHGAGRLQIDRCRAHLELRRPARGRADRWRPHPSDEPGCRVRRRCRECVQAEPGARCLPHQGRWEDMAESPLRLRQHRFGRRRAAAR